MDSSVVVLVNVPFTFLNIVANTFFSFCMVRHGQKIKQPLKLLLGTLICCTISFMVAAMLQLYSDATLCYPLKMLSYLVFVCSLSTSMTSSVWLNFLYYTQIVPAQRALSIWIKRNIKVIIYYIWFLEKMLSLLDIGIVIFDYYDSNQKVFENDLLNFTLYKMVSDQIPALEVGRQLCAAVVVLVKIHFILCLCVMLMSSGSTVVYLSKHMCHMVANGQAVSCPRLKSQIRVTTTGFLQGVLYSLCAAWTLYKYFTQYVLTGSESGYSLTHFTVINVYMVGTTFNLGAGQAVFRQRVADIWSRAAHWCKTSKVQQSEQGG